jgi:hypothetical protein
MSDRGPHDGHVQTKSLPLRHRLGKNWVDIIRHLLFIPP